VMYFFLLFSFSHLFSHLLQTVFNTQFFLAPSHRLSRRKLLLEENQLLHWEKMIFLCECIPIIFSCAKSSSFKEETSSWGKSTFYIKKIWFFVWMYPQKTSIPLGKINFYIKNRWFFVCSTCEIFYFSSSFSEFSHLFLFFSLIFLQQIVMYFFTFKFQKPSPRFVIISKKQSQNFDYQEKTASTF
jgi:hypothetical protein